MARRRGRGALVLAALLLALLVGCTSAADEAPARVTPRPLHVLFVGDSLAEGYYADTPERGFVELLLAEWRTTREVTDVRAAQAGWRTWRITRLLPEPDATDLDLVVLEAGANDVGPTPVADFRGDYQRLLARVSAVAPDAVVLCLTPWGDPADAAPYERVVERACTGAGHLTAPLSDLYAEQANRGPAGSPTALGERDDYHPNDAGHAAIAARVTEALAARTR